MLAIDQQKHYEYLLQLCDKMQYDMDYEMIISFGVDGAILSKALSDLYNKPIWLMNPLSAYKNPLKNYNRALICKDYSDDNMLNRVQKRLIKYSQQFRKEGNIKSAVLLYKYGTPKPDYYAEGVEENIVFWYEYNKYRKEIMNIHE